MEHGDKAWSNVIDAETLQPVQTLTRNEARFSQHAQSFQGLLRGVDQVAAMVGQPTVSDTIGKWAIAGFGAFLLWQVVKGSSNGNR